MRKSAEILEPEATAVDGVEGRLDANLEALDWLLELEGPGLVINKDDVEV